MIKTLDTVAQEMTVFMSLPVLNHLAYMDLGNGISRTGWFCDLETGEVYRYAKCMTETLYSRRYEE